MSYDDVAPEFVSATLHGGILEVTFSEPLRSAYVSFDVTVQRRRLGSVTVVNAPGAASGISTVFALVLCHG